MPRPKKAGWERVTITLSSECVRALRLLSAATREDMGEAADQAMRDGGLLERLARELTNSSPAPRPKPPAPAPQPQPRLAAPAAPRPKPQPHERTPGNSGGDRELLALVEGMMPERFSQGDLATAVGITTANYRAGWRKTGHVPAKYVPAVLTFLESKGISHEHQAQP